MRRFSKALGIILLASLSFLPCSRAEGSGDGKELVRRMVEAINDRDFDALGGIVAPDLRRHCAATPAVDVRSREDFIEFLHQDIAAVPDSRVEIEFLMAGEGMVAGLFHYRGTQKGAWGPFPASNKPVEIPFIGIQRIEAGRIAEIWVEWDNLNALQQLGHFTPPEP